MASRHLFSALWSESVRRVPYVIGVFIFLILLLSFQNNQIAKNNSITNKKLLEKVAEQTEELKAQSKQIKDLSEQNNQLAQQNATHIDCVAKIFAQYTRDQRPVQEFNLNDCIIATSNAPNGSAVPGVSDSKPVTSVTPTQQSQQTAPTSATQQSSTPQPISQTPSQDGVTIPIPLIGPVHVPSPF